jgi:hypothetical protein
MRLLTVSASALLISVRYAALLSSAFASCSRPGLAPPDAEGSIVHDGLRCEPDGITRIKEVGDFESRYDFLPSADFIPSDGEGLIRSRSLTVEVANAAAAVRPAIAWLAINATSVGLRGASVAFVARLGVVRCRAAAAVFSGRRRRSRARVTIGNFSDGRAVVSRIAPDEAAARAASAVCTPD